MIRVLIVDDHVLVREALSSVLENEQDIEVVGQASDGESVLRLCRELHPQVVLMDIALPDVSGIDVTRKLVAENFPGRVLAVSTHIDRRFVTRMLEAGAAGYINKAASKQELLSGIRAVAAGSSYLSQNVAAMMLLNVGAKDKDGVNCRLGKRESQVLALIAEGKSSAQIAERLYIATGTVDVHRRNIMNKLKLHSVVELTRYAIREGLASP
ncbi:MAG: response regulator transcription factor [Proteobacteria bacterium]|nr:response regulator transcription factor [Pseudomonadota bacterium]